MLYHCSITVKVMSMATLSTTWTWYSPASSPLNSSWSWLRSVSRYFYVTSYSIDSVAFCCRFLEKLNVVVRKWAGHMRMILLWFINWCLYHCLIIVRYNKEFTKDVRCPMVKGIGATTTAFTLHMGRNKCDWSRFQNLFVSGNCNGQWMHVINWFKFDSI